MDGETQEPQPKRPRVAYAATGDQNQIHASGTAVTSSSSYFSSAAPLGGVAATAARGAAPADVDEEGQGRQDGADPESAVIVLDDDDDDDEEDEGSGSEDEETDTGRDGDHGDDGDDEGDAASDAHAPRRHPDQPQRRQRPPEPETRDRRRSAREHAREWGRGREERDRKRPREASRGGRRGAKGGGKGRKSGGKKGIKYTGGAGPAAAAAAAARVPRKVERQQRRRRERWRVREERINRDREAMRNNVKDEKGLRGAQKDLPVCQGISESHRRLVPHLGCVTPLPEPLPAEIYSKVLEEVCKTMAGTKFVPGGNVHETEDNSPVRKPITKQAPQDWDGKRPKWNPSCDNSTRFPVYLEKLMGITKKELMEEIQDSESTELLRQIHHLCIPGMVPLPKLARIQRVVLWDVDNLTGVLPCLDFNCDPNSLLVLGFGTISSIGNVPDPAIALEMMGNRRLAFVICEYGQDGVDFVMINTSSLLHEMLPQDVTITFLSCDNDFDTILHRFPGRQVERCFLRKDGTLGTKRLDNNHLTLVYFVIGALDILGELSRSVDSQTSSRLIEYIYSLQLLPIHGNTSEKEATMEHREVILGDNFSRVDVHAITSALHALQKPNGSFVAVAVPGAGECDVRFVYCACVISSLLNDWSGVNKEAAISFILATQTYDGGFGQQPGQESHGGSTYCAVASLALMGELQRLPRRSELLQWLLDRQVSGFQGRINKPADTCYSWWIGATLTLLGAFHLVDFRALRSFLLSCQSGIGGFSKLPEVFPDVLHTYYSFCGLSLGGEPGLAPLDTLLGMTVTSAGKKI
ncbi:protein geranylgeranyltransferase type I beta subunit [Pelomyxa schiedti]|nr:protein geranylgeranyltransferase type I beta subunit [Pelomyxa schiedti]